MAQNPKDKSGDTWADDQKEHGYYYDDAHGYEDYEPEEDEEETEGDARSGDAETRGDGDADAN